MSGIALKSPAPRLPGLQPRPLQQSTRHLIDSANDAFSQFARLRSDSSETAAPLRWDLIALIALVLLAHGVAITQFIQSLSEPIAAPAKKEVVIEFVKPVVPPPAPIIEPPKPLPPEPKVKRAPPPPTAIAQPAPLKTAPAEDNIQPSDLTVQENTEAVKTSSPVVAEALPTPPPAPAPVIKEEPITEATGYAGYLKNPPPEYPSFAQRQGWEGKVVLRVRVLANGKPSQIEIKQSSGRKTLDEAAVEAVGGWMFEPAKRGSTPIDGWATVPIEFRLGK